MKIKKMRALFGTLENAEIELSDGLNIIEAPNEHGKSTWCAFIRAMLYGINTSERDKIGSLSDKTKYRPWSGGEMRGGMEIEYGGQNILLERTNLNQYPMKKLTAIYRDSGTAVNELSGENCGETLTGVPERVFERTAFIRQTDIRISQTPELEKRVAAIVTTGGEMTSYSDADALLRSWQRKIKHNKSGSLPAAEAELMETRRKLDKIEKLTDELAESSLTLEKLADKCVQLERDMQAHAKLEQRAVQERVINAKKRAVKAGEDVERIRERMCVDGRPITREELTGIREDFASLGSLVAVLKSAQDRRAKAENSAFMAESVKSDSKYSKFTEDEALKKADETEKLEKLTSQTKKADTFRTVMIVLAIVGLAGAAAFSGFLPIKANIPAVIGCAVGALASSILFVLSIVRLKKAKKDLSALLLEFGAMSAQQIRRGAEEYANICRHAENEAAALNEARRAETDAETAAREADAALLKKAQEIFPNMTSSAQIPASISGVEQTMEELTKAEFALISEQNIAATLAAEYGENIDTADLDFIPVPLRNKADTETALERTREQMEKLRDRLAIGEGEKRAVGDPSVLAGKRDNLAAKVEADMRDYEALEIAVSTLRDASVEMQARFSPIIGRAAGEYISMLTGGRYEKLSFDKTFDASAKRTDDPISRGVLSLSEGTGDQIYLALRLAMCSLILGGDDPCPVILDDALTNFDEERTENALKLLKEIAKTRQVLLFTCHSREGRFFAGDEDVNHIKI